MVKPAQKIWQKVTNDKFTGKANTVVAAVDKLVDFVKPTLGPKIQHVLVDAGYKTELMDDGVSIAREFELEDDFEDAVARYVKEVSQRTDDKAGDGTTTTMVLLQALLHEIMASGKAYPEVRKELDTAVAEAVKQLADKTCRVDSEDVLYKVALTSMNDEEAARLVAKVVWETGSKGAVTITDYTGRGYESERLEGFTMGRGFIARGMINDKENQVYAAPNKNFPGIVGIAVVEHLIATEKDILPILQAADGEGIKNLVIFCPNLIGEALGIVAMNQMRGAFNICAVQLPGQGEKIKDYVQDICAVTGGHTPVGEFDASCFGKADRVRVSCDDSTIIGGHGDKKEIGDLIENLRQKSELSKDSYEKDYYHQRQARLMGGVVMIKVGGVTETEQRLRLKKVEDAVNACKCALEEGVVPGAGMTLNRIKTSSEILNKTLPVVLHQVMENAQIGEIDVGEDAENTLNALDGTVGKYLEIGVVDATKVLRVAVENAVSIAVILFSISGIITSKRDYGNTKP